MAFNEKEQAIIDWGTKNGKSVKEIQDAVFRFRTTGSPAAPGTQKLSVAKPTFTQDFVSDIKETGQALADTLDTGELKTAEVALSGQSTPRSLFQRFGVGAQTVARAAGDIAIGAGKAVLPQAAEEAIGGAAQAVAEPIVQSDPVQRVLQGYEKMKQTNPALARDIDAALGITELGATITGASAATRTFSQAAKAALKSSDEILASARASVPAASSVGATSRGLIKDLRLQLSDINPQVETVLKRSTFDDVNKHFQAARNAIADPSKATPLEIAGQTAEDAYNLIDKARQAAVQGKKSILSAVADERVAGNVINDVYASGVSQFAERFGATVGSKGQISQLKGRTLTLDSADQKFASDYFSRLSSLGVAPSIRQVDDFVDWAQGQLYKQSKTLSKLDAASDPVISQLRQITGDLNSRLKDTVQNGYGEVNQRVSKLIELQDELSLALGADARKGGGLMKRLFSPTGGNTKELFEQIRQETGIDLVKEATLAKFAMENVGDIRQRSLLQNLDVALEEGSQLDLTKPLSIIKFIRERADLDGQELANELIRKFNASNQ